jgi:hypothetical protein
MTGCSSVGRGTSVHIVLDAMNGGGKISTIAGRNRQRVVDISPETKPANPLFSVPTFFSPVTASGTSQLIHYAVHDS